MTKRIDLGDGDWAELNDRPTHGQYNAIYKAWIASSLDPGTYMDLSATAAVQLVISSSIRASDGQLVDPKSNIDAVPVEKLLAMAAGAIAIFQAVKIPNVSTAKSDEPSTAESPATETSPTP